MRKIKKLFSRFPLVAITIILMFLLGVALFLGAFFVVQLVIVYFFPNMVRTVFWVVVVLDWLVMLVTVLHCANRDMVPETKIPWLITIFLLNVLGVATYITFSHNRPTRRQGRLYAELHRMSEPFNRRTIDGETLSRELGSWAEQSEALYAADPSAVLHGNTRTEYFPVGEAFAKRLIEDLEGAKQYIFLEYFIICKGKFWSAVLDVLTRKVKEGVEVRVIYDDIGSLGKVHMNYHRTLRKLGIRCVKFNPFVPVVTNVHNNRDHRKIVVIDGKIGYTGGINLADEYVNLESPFGHWKDTAVRLEGEGVKNFILMFLKTYAYSTRKAEDFAPYIPETYEKFEGEGYVQPYGDGPRPLYGSHMGEDVYIGILNCARRYVYIATPYLIIDYNLREALLLAAKRGVDVRLLTPHIPDKKLVYALTRSNYLALIRGGVKIYEYTPGFVHAKSFVADDRVGIVGTINLDYRSFLHHFEDAVLMFGTKAVSELKEDMETSFAVSALQTQEDAKKNVVWRWLCEIMKIFAPLF